MGDILYKTSFSEIDFTESRVNNSKTLKFLLQVKSVIKVTEALSNIRSWIDVQIRNCE